MKFLLILISALISFLCFNAQTGYCNNNEWNAETQTLTLRGIDISGATDPDAHSVFAVMHYTGLDAHNRLRFQLLTADWDSERGEGTYYPDTQRVHFLITLQEDTYDVWMEMERDNQGRIFFIVTSLTPTEQSS